MIRICKVALVLTVVWVGAGGQALAQPGPIGAGLPPAVKSQEPVVSDVETQTASAPLVATPSLVSPTLAATFTSIGGDLRHMFSINNAGIAAAFAGTALVAAHWDGAAVSEVRELPFGAFKPGNATGGAWTQMGAAFGTFAIGKATGNAPLAIVGSHLIRAQVASQLVVEGLKLATERSRPDASNRYSFPSGHAASAFATATVLQRDFGWKVGIPAYAVSAYVAAARMNSNKHYLSDVIVGAAVGVSAGRAVTFGPQKLKFDVGFTPTSGGAALTITKRR